MSKSRFPSGWDEHRVRRVLEHYDAQNEQEAVAEDEAAFEDSPESTIQVPIELIPAVRELIGKYRLPDARS